jgi:DNA-binding transcriptional MerR regulator
MLIHEAAAITGLTIEAIRYDECQHLLDERHITRQLNGYRSFTPAATSDYSISSTHARRAILWRNSET